MNDLRISFKLQIIISFFFFYSVNNINLPTSNLLPWFCVRQHEKAFISSTLGWREYLDEYIYVCICVTMDSFAWMHSCVYPRRYVSVCLMVCFCESRCQKILIFDKEFSYFFLSIVNFIQLFNGFLECLPGEILKYYVWSFLFFFIAKYF